MTGCGVKTEQLPIVNYPYVSEIEFLKEVKNVEGKAKKKKFKDNHVTSPFYFFLKINDMENNGTVSVVFYESAEKKGKKAAEKTFGFGEAGKYYEYILFFDHVDNLVPGKYRYAVFCNKRLLYESYMTVNPPLLF